MDNKPQFITTFIDILRRSPCLWKVQDESYSNRKLKNDAYNNLLEHYKTAIPTATIDHVKRKINNLRSTFRKELKKVRRLRSSDNSYTPSLWYFDLLLFTADQKPRSTSLSDNYMEIEYNDSNEDPLSADSLWPPQSPESSMEPSQKTSPVSKKRRETIINNDEYTHINTQLKVSDEFDGIGLNVACKLRRMEGEQRIFAELLINKILLNGVRQRLQDETDLIGLVG